MENKKVLAAAMVMLFLVSFIYLSPVEAQEPLVGQDDDHQKQARIETEVSFRWTVYRNSTRDYVFTVDVQGGLQDWMKDISSDYFVLDDNKPHEIIIVTLEVPKNPGRDVTTGTVIFRYREINSTVHESIEKTISVEVVGVAPTPEGNIIVGGFQNPLPSPLNNPYGAFGLNLLIWFIISWIFYFLVSPIIHRFAKKTKTDVDELIIRMLRRPILFLILIYGFIDSVMKLNLALGIRTTIYQIYMIIVIVIGVVITYKILIAILNQISKERGGRDSPFGQVLKPVLEKVFAIIIIIGGLVMVLRVVGIEVTALLAGAGVAGLVIAFAAQDTLGNFFSGMHLLVDRPFSIGEIIMLEDGEYCRVEEIGMRSTKLYNIRDHEGIILPNNAIASQKIVNIAKPDTLIRVRIEVGVAYGSDIGKVKEILNEVAEEHPKVINDEIHEIVVNFRDFADSSLDFSLRVWIDDIPRQWRIMGEIRERIDERFREENIEIPFPQRTVWFHEMDKGK